MGTAQCLEWFVTDAIRSSVDFIVINGVNLPEEHALIPAVQSTEEKVCAH